MGVTPLSMCVYSAVLQYIARIHSMPLLSMVSLSLNIIPYHLDSLSLSLFSVPERRECVERERIKSFTRLQKAGVEKEKDGFHLPLPPSCRTSIDPLFLPLSVSPLVQN